MEPTPGRIAVPLRRRCTAALTSRGVFRSNICSMGATRLKIIDLSGGDQPITTDDGDTTIVFNGEVYNYQEVRAELEARGDRFHSRTDTETVLHAFLEWDVACFSRLRRMFAVTLWTESAKRLVWPAIGWGSSRSTPRAWARTSSLGRN